MAATVRSRAFTLALALALPLAARAAEEGTELRAVVAVVPPGVIETGGHLTGFSVDLWNEVAARLGVRTTWRVTPDAASGFRAVRDGDADIGVTGAFYTPEHDREFDFTYPILDAGLQVLVHAGGHGEEERPLATFLGLVTSGSMLYWLGAFVLLILVPAHVVWLLDRRHPDGIGGGEPYVPGILRAIEWSAQAALGQAMTMPRRGLASLVAHLWLFLGVVFVAFFTAQLTAAITLRTFHGQIGGPGDLRGKKVGTLAGTAAVEPLRQLGARVDEFAAADAMFAALTGRQVDAVVTGSPALRYYAAHDGAGRVRVVGPEFRRGELAFFVRLGSPLRKKVDGALIAIRYDGTYDRIHDRWFGSEQ